MKKPVPENYEELLNMANGKPSQSIFDAEITDEMRQEWAKKRRKEKIVGTINGVILVVGMMIVLSLLTLDYLDCSSRGGAYIRSMFWYSCIEAR